MYLQLDVYDWDSDGSHDLIGGFTTTVDELAASQHGKEVGKNFELFNSHASKPAREIIMVGRHCYLCLSSSTSPSEPAGFDTICFLHYTSPVSFFRRLLCWVDMN